MSEITDQDKRIQIAEAGQGHDALDRAVDRCYCKEPFATDRQRVEYLFALYAQLTTPLAASAKATKRQNMKRYP